MSTVMHFKNYNALDERIGEKIQKDTQTETNRYLFSLKVKAKKDVKVNERDHTRFTQSSARAQLVTSPGRASPGQKPLIRTKIPTKRHKYRNEGLGNSVPTIISIEQMS